VRRVVLHCIPGMGGGGTERQLSYIAGAMTGIGWRVVVALMSGGPNLERLHGGGAIVHQLHARNNHDPRIVLDLVRIIERERPDIVHVSLLQMEVCGGMAAEMKRVPWVFSERSSEGMYPPKFKHRLRVWMASRADAVVSNSCGGDRYWKTRLAPDVPRYVVPNAVPLEEIDRIAPLEADRVGIDPAARIVLFFGRFSAEKNLDVLVQALGRVTQCRGVIGVLAGAGPQHDAVRRLVGDLGIADRVRVPGYVDEIWSWIKRADVLVSISLFEGRPNAVLESMACGCPLVVSDIPAHREILSDDEAWFVNPRDPDAVAEGVMQVLRDGAAARTRAAAARRHVEAWSVTNIAREYDRIYREVLARRGRGRG
jgi:glycosyltransferase involved in cell wall biosynthesis